jgi:hypothetical protein
MHLVGLIYLNVYIIYVFFYLHFTEVFCPVFILTSVLQSYTLSLNFFKEAYFIKDMYTSSFTIFKITQQNW